MGRAKLKLELIPNPRSRRVTFEKRKKGLMKKAEEFKTLCGVDTCVIIYPMGTSGDGLVKPEIWPPDSKEMERIVCRYQSEAAHRRAKHVTGLREFFTSRNKKIETELAEARRANWEAKYPAVSEEFLKDLSGPQLRSLLSAVGDRLKQAKTRLVKLKEKRRVETVAQSDWIVPSGGGDLLASDAAFVQDGVVKDGVPFEFLYRQDKENTRIEMAAAPGDWVLPSGEVDVKASNAGFIQDRVVEAGLPLGFPYQQDEESRVEITAAPIDWIVSSNSVEFQTSNTGYVQDGVVEDGLPFEFLFEENSSVGSTHEYANLPLSSSPTEYSTQFGPPRVDSSWCSTVNEGQNQSMKCDSCNRFYPQNVYHDQAQFFNAPAYS